MKTVHTLLLILLIGALVHQSSAQNSTCNSPSGPMQQPDSLTPTCFSAQSGPHSGPLTQFYTFVATTANMAAQLTPVVSTSCSFPNTAIDYSNFQLYSSGDCAVLLCSSPNFNNLTIGTQYTFGLTMTPQDQSCVWLSQTCPRVVDVVIPLGAELMYWTGKVDRDEVKLSWDVIDVNYIHEFRVKRCGQALTPFMQVGTVGANARGPQGFTWIDPMPLSGKIDYQLEIVDHNGNVSLSEVMELNVEANHLLQIYPNPCVNFLQVSFPESLQQVYSLAVSNLNGSYIEHLNGTPTELNNRLSLLVSRLLPGVYMIQCFDGKKVTAAKFVRI